MECGAPGRLCLSTRTRRLSSAPPLGDRDHDGGDGDGDQDADGGGDDDGDTAADDGGDDDEEEENLLALVKMLSLQGACGLLHVHLCSQPW